MTLPVPAILDLWSLGHAARDVAERLGIEGGHKAVTKIIGQARLIADPRAVLHTAANGRLIGRPGRYVKPGRRKVKGEVVPVIRKPRRPRKYVPTGNRPGAPKKAVCKNGHPRTPETTYRRCGSCKICRQLKYRVTGA